MISPRPPSAPPRPAVGFCLTRQPAHAEDDGVCEIRRRPHSPREQVLRDEVVEGPQLPRSYERVRHDDGREHPHEQLSVRAEFAVAELFPALSAAVGRGRVPASGGLLRGGGVVLAVRTVEGRWGRGRAATRRHASRHAPRVRVHLHDATDGVPSLVCARGEARVGCVEGTREGVERSTGVDKHQEAQIGVIVRAVPHRPPRGRHPGPVGGTVPGPEQKAQ
mmetsp:Transcript_40787/g.79802  ORF Transcript_40787/g.79802 Transcript_40787/m.79802 type:complete len:221 (+) Transcript_40787:2305-2967(+)